MEEEGLDLDRKEAGVALGDTSGEIQAAVVAVLALFGLGVFVWLGSA